METFEQRYEVAGPVRLEVHVAAGDIDVTSVQGRQAVVEISGPQRLLDATTVELRGDRLGIKQDRERGLKALLAGGDFKMFMDGPLSIRVQVPHGSRVELMNASAAATLTGSFGDISAKSASGGVAVRGDVTGVLKVQNVSGDVSVGNVRGDVRMQTVSGDVTADAVNGDVHVTSVSGDVDLGRLSQGSVQLQTVSGDLRLAVARGSSVDVDATSTSGDLRSDVELSDAPASDGGPTVVIRARSVSGAVRIVRAPEPVALEAA